MRYTEALFLLVVVLADGAGVGFGLTTDGIALLELKAAIVLDPGAALASWNATDATPCHWHGVACSTVAGSLVPRVVSLTVVCLNLSGNLPPSLAVLDQLRRLSLHHNALYGSLPLSLFNSSSSLRTIHLQNNHLTGPIPPEISLISTLQNLDLSYNLFYGVVPSSLPSCLRLQHLILSHNFFSGSIPDGLGVNLTSLQQFDLSANSLSGTIPTDLGNLTSLQTTLNLSYNLLSGTIPASLGNLPYTVSLDLSHNNLSGQIPQQGSLPDQGPGPFVGNPALCGFPLSRRCSPAVPYSLPPIPSIPSDGSPPIGPFSAQMPPRVNETDMPRRASLGAGTIVAIAIGDALGIAMVGAILVYFYWKTSICEDKCCPYQKKPSSSSHAICCRVNYEDSEGTTSTEKGAQDQGDLVSLDKGFSCELDELLRASAYVLGKGGLGIVYKVVLANGLPVAVRRLGEGGAQRFKEFEAEVQAIARARHPNVVRLRAYYWAEDEKLLVYDFIPNGSLTAALHVSPSRALTWSVRLRIAKGAAAGVAFLHECSPRKYVHGNLKTSKVLLDMHMQPYVADFGLARLASMATGGATPSGVYGGRSGAATSFPGRSLAASSGFYRAPECFTDGKPTQKWDVYAFGVILLEVLTGRSPAVQETSFGEDLVSWVGHAFKEEKPLARVLDPSLASEAAHVEKDVVEAFRVALSCASSLPEERPKMKSVFESLSKLSPLP